MAKRMKRIMERVKGRHKVCNREELYHSTIKSLGDIYCGYCMEWVKKKQ